MASTINQVEGCTTIDTNLTNTQSPDGNVGGLVYTGKFNKAGLWEHGCKWAQLEKGMKLWRLYLDIDKLPKHFETWEGFRAYMQWKFPNAPTFRSSGGRSKTVIIVSSRCMTPRIARDTLRAYFGEIAEHMDKNATMRSFMPLDEWPAVKEKLDKFEPYPAVRDTPDWRMKPMAPRPGLTATENKVLRFINSWEGGEIIQIPQKFVSDVTNLPIAAVNRAIKVLIKKGEIEVADHHYTPGESAKTYRMVSYQLLATRTARSTPGIVFMPPREIPDGEWYDDLWDATNCFEDGVSFMEWVMSLPNIHARGKYRPKVARRAWAKHAIRNGLDPATA